MYTVAPAPGGPTQHLHVSGRNKNIKDIDLGTVFFTQEDKETLALITSFDLSYNCIERLVHLDALVSLTQLDASYNCISMIGVLPTTITRLDISHNKLATLEGVSALGNLRELDVRGNKLTTFKELSSSHTLQVLRADGNRITSTEGLEGMTSLRVLSLDSNLIDNLNELIFISSTRSLKTFSARFNPVAGIAGYKRFVIQLLPSLTSLDGIPIMRDITEDSTQGRDNYDSSEDLLTPVAQSLPLPTPYPRSSALGTVVTSAADGSSCGAGFIPKVGVQEKECVRKKNRSLESSSKGATAAVKSKINGKRATAVRRVGPASSDLSTTDVASSDASFLLNQDAWDEGATCLSAPKGSKGQRQRLKPSSPKARPRSRSHSSYASINASKAPNLFNFRRMGSVSSATAKPSHTLERQLHVSNVLVEELRKENEYLLSCKNSVEAELDKARKTISLQLTKINELKQKCSAAEGCAASSKKQLDRAKLDATLKQRRKRDAVEAANLEQERLRAGYEVQIADLKLQLKEVKMQLRKAVASSSSQSQHALGVPVTRSVDDDNPCKQIRVALGDGTGSPLEECNNLSLVVSSVDTTDSVSRHSSTKNMHDTIESVNNITSSAGTAGSKLSEDLTLERLPGPVSYTA
uniref:Putative leucine-rich repeat protein (LRRP) n=1 Tax=Trypanosoma congolense (strain IL3000) TaxID=1068625 RepID=G0UVT3_TRYCI|nr:putative leucine-rich repeat protein (LRRP) [Trypanosoma congolense IL3000]